MVRDNFNPKGRSHSVFNVLKSVQDTEFVICPSIYLYHIVGYNTNSTDISWNASSLNRAEEL